MSQDGDSSNEWQDNGYIRPLDTFGDLITNVDNVKISREYGDNFDDEIEETYSDPLRSYNRQESGNDSTQSLQDTTNQEDDEEERQSNPVGFIHYGFKSLSFDMFKILNEHFKGENLFFSPLSIACALTSCYVGAKNQMKLDLQKVLKFRNASYDDIITGLKVTRIFSNNLQSPYLNVSKLYASDKYRINNIYSMVVKNSLDVEVESLDFSKSEESAFKVNNWIRKKTNNKISSIISEDLININSRLILINTVYFKGAWLHEFNKSNTKEKTFYCLDGSEKRTQFMNLTTDFEVKDLEKFGLRATLCSLPFNDYNTNLTIFLPNSNDNFRQVEMSLDESIFEEIFCSGEDMNPSTDIYLPKFKFEFSESMNSILEELGASEIFSENADFSIMSAEKGLKVDEVIHHTFIELDEKGAEAAASTTVRCIGLTAKPPNEESKPKVFDCDRPFIYIIHDSNKIIFMGKYMSPQ